MSVLVDKNTRLVVQGITGSAGAFHTRQCIEYGTNVVAGVTPGKGGQKFDDKIPVFDTVWEAKQKTNCNVSMIFVPAAFAADSILEAVDADVDLVVCITEGIPVMDMMRVKAQMRGRRTRLIGPNCPGIITPGACKIGIMPGYIHKEGKVGVISRSGALTYEAVWQLTSRGYGQSTCIGIGGDPIGGLSHLDAVKLLNDDKNTDAMILIGEIGGSAEEEAAAWIKDNYRKPVAAFIAGLTAPPGRRMGHAGAIVSGGKGTAEGKIEALKAGGIAVAETPATMADTLIARMKRLFRFAEMTVAELRKTESTPAPKAANASRGLEGIIANTTRLSDVIGDKGQLVYSGYDINDLAGKVSYKEVVYLLWKGKLPNRRELDEFMHALRAERQLPDPVIEFIKSAPKDADPMDVMRTAISMLGLYDPDIHKEATREINERRARSITAKIGVIAAYFHRARQGKSLPPVRDDLTEAEHFLYLICGEQQAKEASDALDVAFVLHADHGMNASTFSARVTISTLSDFYSAITSAIGTLKGPLHGGANEGVIQMLQQIGEEKNVDAYIEKQLAQKKKIMGIGHRVYKTLDPRAPHLRAMAVKLSEKIGEPKWIKMSERIAELMKQRKNLNANVDFYSATVYHSLGIPTDLFTPIFAIARCSGWCAHVLEQLEDNRLYRPLSEYIGEPPGKKVVPIDQRP